MKTVTKQEVIHAVNEIALAHAIADLEKRNHPVHEHVQAATGNMADKSGAIAGLLLVAAGFEPGEALTTLLDAADYVAEELEKLQLNPLPL